MTHANESLRFALQAIRDEATKPLDVEIERLREALRIIQYWAAGDSKHPNDIARDALAQGVRHE